MFFEFNTVLFTDLTQKAEIHMHNPKTILKGRQQLSEHVYFISTSGEEIRPIFQLNTETKISSYRVYPNGGNRKEEEKPVFCYIELAKLLMQGTSVRCKVPDGASSNRSLFSEDVEKLHIEISKV